MKTFIALFRGINVGGKNKIIMKELKLLMEACGYENIRTYIQSGNAVFDSQTQPDDKIVELIDEQYGFRPHLMILTEIDLEQAIANNPYPDAEGKTCHFYFCKSCPEAVDDTKLELLRSDSEEYTLADTIFYLHAPDGISRSKLAANVEKCLGVPCTARNLNTVRKLWNMVQDS